jgi:hypothetical protein
MRKLLLLMALCMATVAVQAETRFGIKGGLTFQDYKAVDIQNDWDGVFESRTSWNAGVFAQFKLLGLALQPELLYSEKGTDVLKMKYLELPLSIRVNLPGIPKLLKPYVIGGPYVSYALDGELDVEGEIQDFDYKKMDYGAGIGVGCDLFNRLQLTARYDWGFGKVADGDLLDVNAKGRVFSLSLGFYF